MLQNHMTKYFTQGKRTCSSIAAEQKELSRLYSRLHSIIIIAVQFNQHNNCASATVDTVVHVLGTFKAACLILRTY